MRTKHVTILLSILVGNAFCPYYASADDAVRAGMANMSATGH